MLLKNALKWMTNSNALKESLVGDFFSLNETVHKFTRKSFVIDPKHIHIIYTTIDAVLVHTTVQGLQRFPYPQVFATRERNLALLSCMFVVSLKNVVL